MSGRLFRPRRVHTRPYRLHRPRYRRSLQSTWCCHCWGQHHKCRSCRSWPILPKHRRSLSRRARRRLSRQRMCRKNRSMQCRQEHQRSLLGRALYRLFRPRRARTHRGTPHHQTRCRNLGGRLEPRWCRLRRRRSHPRSLHHQQHLHSRQVLLVLRTRTLSAQRVAKGYTGEANATPHPHVGVSAI